MSIFRKPNRLYSVLGVGCALLVPALAVGLEIPNAFTSGTAIRAADVNENFNAIGEELADLRSQIEALQSKLKLGARQSLFVLTDETSAVIFQAKTAGFVTLIPGGSGYGNIDPRLKVGDAIGSDNWSVTCGATDCSGQSRVNDGDTLTLQVAANEYFIAYQGGATSTSSVQVIWQPIYGDDPANGGPTLIRSGELPPSE